MIAGTTSVGKTDLSLRLASLLNGEIISADSAQVLRMDFLWGLAQGGHFLQDKTVLMPYLAAGLQKTRHRFSKGRQRNNI